jgi:PEP-CTERM motif-containing protein
MRFPAIILALVAGTFAAHAVVIPVFDNEVGPGGAGSTFTPSYVVSTTDLLNSLTPSGFGGNFAAVEITGGLPVLTDGTFGTITEPGGAADRTHLIFAIAGGGSGTGTFVTYTLNTSVNTLGYDIDRIVVYGGWNDNGRDQQLFTAAYSLVGDATFIDLPPVDFNPVIGANLQSATRVTLAESAPTPLASRVDEIRFTFSPSPENGYTGYAELDVIGRATVPEPGSVMLLALGALSALGVRRVRP